MVIGTCAYCGSGQDTLADGFCQYLGFKKYSMGDVVRKIAKDRNLPMRRDILQDIRVDCDAKYGRNFIPDIIVKQINDVGDAINKVIITGIRTEEEYSILYKRLGMKLLFVYADENIRYQRMLKRKCEKDEETISELRLRMERENELFDYQKLEKMALYRFDFNMELRKYKQNEQSIVDKVYIKMCERKK